MPYKNKHDKAINDRQYQLANKEKKRIIAARYRNAHPERIRAASLKWYYKKGQDLIFKERRRWKNLMNKHALTQEQYEELVTKQKGVCGICGLSPVRALRVDHDHVTGQIRGLLCDKCNTGLGQFDDSLSRLRAAADYVERTSKELDDRPVAPPLACSAKVSGRSSVSNSQQAIMAGANAPWYDEQLVRDSLSRKDNGQREAVQPLGNDSSAQDAPVGDNAPSECEPEEENPYLRYGSRNG